jgi:hypothetical protein
LRRPGDYSLEDAVGQSPSLRTDQRLLYLLGSLERFGVLVDVIWPLRKNQRAAAQAPAISPLDRAQQLVSAVSSARARALQICADALSLRSNALEVRLVSAEMRHQRQQLRASARTE